MTLKVYIWLPQGITVGHASMQLSNGTYISLWPGEDKMGKTIKQIGIAMGTKQHYENLSDSLDEDIHREKRPPDHVFSIEGLDETAIQSWWDSFNEKWHLLSQNCCDTVIGGLRAGGADKRIAPSGGRFIRTPSDVAEYCKRLSRSRPVPQGMPPGLSMNFM